MISPAATETPATPTELLLTPTGLDPGLRIRLEWIDGLRGFLALYVLFGHLLFQRWKAGRDWGWLNWLVEIFGHGHYIVVLFILVSGFCLMMPVARRGTSARLNHREFFRRRFRRILPPYYAAILLSLLLIRFTDVGQDQGGLWSLSVPVSNFQILIHALLLQDFYNPGKINYPLSTIATELHLYLLFPALVWLWRRAGSTALILLPVLLVLLTRYIGTPSWLPINWNFLAPFASGMAAAAVCFSPKTSRLRRHASAIPDFAWLPLVALAVYLTTFAPLDLTYPTVAFGVVAALLLIRMTLSPRDEASLLRWPFETRTLRFFGLFAYSIYLTHAPLLQAIQVYIIAPVTADPKTALLLHLAVSPALCLLLAYAFHTRFERPFLRYIPKASYDSPPPKKDTPPSACSSAG